MSPPPLPELLKAAKQLVQRADKDGTLEYAFKLISENIKIQNNECRTLTPRLIRHEIEKQFELEAGTLVAPEYKGPLKGAVADALVSSGSSRSSSRACITEFR